VRQILRLLGARYGIALIIAVVVLGIVAITRGISGSVPPPAVVEASPTPLSSGDAEATDSTDDGEAAVGTPQPSTSPGAPAPDTVATRFTTAWLHHAGVTGDEWRAGLKPYATEALMAELQDTDPGGVPADRITGSVQVIPRDVDRVDVMVPVDSGRLSLRLFATNGRWFVDGVDWERA
jgi:hypothetical protein